MSCPAAADPVSAPYTKPRPLANQRVEMIAPSTIDTTPIPRPTPTPHVSASCSGVMTKVDAVVDTAISPSAMRIMRRTPKRSMNAAANGPTAP